MLERSPDQLGVPFALPETYSFEELCSLCVVRPHVLKYWEQEFPQLGGARHLGSGLPYGREDVLLVRKIRSLLLEQGFTIAGARARLEDDARSSGGHRYRQLLGEMIVELESLRSLLSDRV